MATVTISTIKTIPDSASFTPGVTLTSGDTLNLLATGGIVNYGTGNSPGVSGAGSNSLVLNGDIFAAHADAVDISGSGGNDINITATSTLTGIGGLAIAGNNNSLGIAGQVGAARGNWTLFCGPHNPTTLLP